MTFGARRWLIHLSDLHLCGHPGEQPGILRGLVAALRTERARQGCPPSLVCLTGDVFDSATLAPDRAVGAFSTLLDQMHDALGPRVPTIIVPGNHDRRREGFFLPYDRSLFDALRLALRGRAWVHPGAPFLAEVVPHEVHGLPLWVIAYDSNHLPEGVLGAGGAMRQEDLLRAAAIIDGHRPEWPVLFLLHHHLIPTPLTDLGPIEVEDASSPIRWLVERGLPWLLANGDREELFMTALGAGTALSTLQSMGRPVLVLHGHKHYATARLLSGTRSGQGDLMILSAGSGGTAQRWDDGTRNAARLWPSFNVIELEHNRIEVDQVAFAWRDVSDEVARRPMVCALRRDARWLPIDSGYDDAVEPGPRLLDNFMRATLSPSPRSERWDCVVERRVRFDPEHPTTGYEETVEGFSDTIVVDERKGARYRVPGGMARATLRVSDSPYGHVALMNRYQCGRATLTVAGLGGGSRTAFGSATDLGTGLERPIPVEMLNGDEVGISVDACPPRTLLRLYWLLESDRAEPERRPRPDTHGARAPLSPGRYPNLPVT